MTASDTKGETMDKATAAKVDFQFWMDKVGDEVLDLTEGMVEVSDLPDIDYFDLWDRGTTYDRAASIALKNAGWTE